MMIKIFIIVAIASVRAEIEISAGAFWNPIPSVIGYEASVPLLYSTDWINGKILKMDILDTPCENIADSECLLLNKMGKLDEALQEELNIWTEATDTKQLQVKEEKKSKSFRAKRGLAFLGGALSWCCDVATQQDMKNFVDSEDQLKDEIEKATSGLDDTIIQISSMSDAFKEFQNKSISAFYETENRVHVVEKFVNLMRSDINRNSDSIHNKMTRVYKHQLQNLGRLVQVTRITQRQTIIQSCENKKIPKLIVSPNTLRKDLEKLNNVLVKENHKLAISVNDLYKYYELQISQCIFHDNKLKINIKIPIIQNNYNWKMYELLTTPFAYEDKTCSINHETVYLAIDKQKRKKHIRQISGSNLHQCKPHEDKLCFLPRFSAEYSHGPGCSKVLYLGATLSEIMQKCPVTCHKSKTLQISEPQPHVFVLTHPQANTSIVCPNNTHYFNKDVYSHPGALKIMLPCQCQLIQNSEVLIPKRYPCINNNVEEPEFNHMIPAAWSSLNSFILNPLQPNTNPKFTNLNECLNANWTIAVPYTNLTRTDHELKEIIKRVETNFRPITHTRTLQYNVTLIVWNIILTVLVTILIRKNYPAYMCLPQIQPVTADNMDLGHEIVLYGSASIVAIMCITILILCLWKFCKKSIKKPDLNKDKSISKVALILEEDQLELLRYQVYNKGTSGLEIVADMHIV